jgi:hypothetical protein
VTDREIEAVELTIQNEERLSGEWARERVLPLIAEVRRLRAELAEYEAELLVHEDKCSECRQPRGERHIYWCGT